MKYFLLVLVILLVTFQAIASKEYNTKSKNPNTFSFSVVTTLFALIFFLVSAKFKLNFTKEVFVYSVFFGIAFAMAKIGAFLAIKWGSLSLSVLINSYSLLIPTFYGIIVLNEGLNLIGIIGFILLAISLLLIYDKKEKAVFSFKWLVSVAIGFIGNGLCSTIQKMQQMEFSGEFKNEFMIMALTVCLVILLIMSIINKENPKNDVKLCMGYGILSGIANGVVNLLVMVLTATIPNAILFPSISAGGIALGFILAIFYYKERLTKIQLAGYIIGTASVILLNL